MDYSKNYLNQFLGITNTRGRDADSVYHVLKQRTSNEINELLDQPICAMFF